MAGSRTTQPAGRTPAKTAGKTKATADGDAASASEEAVAVTADAQVTKLEIPGVGTIPLPPPDELVYLAGVVLLAGTGLLSWPVALTVGTGHLLAHNRHRKLLRKLGEALEEA